MNEKQMKSSGTKVERTQAEDLEDRFSKINFVLQKIDGHFETDDIHDFRVEIKKLKALIRLFKSAAPETSLSRFPKKLNRIYKALGLLREWQIQHQKIVSAFGEGDSKPPLSYINEISRKTELQKRRAGKLLNPLPLLKKNKEELKRQIPDIISQVARQSFILKKMKNIHQLLLKGATDDESMHYMRKMLKDAQYTLSGSKKNPEKNSKVSRLKNIQKVSGQLGELHDLHISIILLNRQLRSVKNKSKEKTFLRKIRFTWQSEKEKIRQETLKYIKEMDNAIFPNPYTDPII